MKFIARLLINAAALWVAALLLGPERIQIPNVQTLNGAWQLLLVALLFGLLNAIVRPILALLTCPLQILTLGLFTFVLNAVMLLLTSSVAGFFGITFQVNGFISALLGALIITVVSTILTLVVGDNQR